MVARLKFILSVKEDIPSERSKEVTTVQHEKTIRILEQSCNILFIL